MIEAEQIQSQRCRCMSKVHYSLCQQSPRIDGTGDVQSELEGCHVEHCEGCHSPECSSILDQRADTDEKAVDCASVHTGQEDIPSTGGVGKEDTGQVGSNLSSTVNFNFGYIGERENLRPRTKYRH